MSIQTGYSISAYRGVDQVRISNPRTVTTPSTFADILGMQSGDTSRTQVIISDAARQVANPAGTPTQGRTAIQEDLLKYVASHPQDGEKYVSDMVSSPSGIFYDISDQVRPGGVHGPVNKLSSSGRIIDDAFKAKFAKEAAVVDAQRKAIYESEKTKGTPADQILAKIFDYINSQSRDYLEATGWTESVGNKAA